MGFTYKDYKINTPSMDGYTGNNTDFKYVDVELDNLDVDKQSNEVESVSFNDSDNRYTDSQRSGATVVVGCTSILSGVGKIVEYGYDGLNMISTLPFYAAIKVADLFTGDNKANELMDRTLDDIRRDRIGELNKYFYENNKIGIAINDASNMKYDSDTAKSITNTTEFAGKVAIATAATIATGGATAPLVMGALYGTGKTAQMYANTVDRENGQNYNYAAAVLKSATGGATGAVDWWGAGQIGSMAVGGVKALGALKASGVGAKDLLGRGIGYLRYARKVGLGKQIISNLKANVGVGSYIKALGKNLIMKHNLLPTLALTSDHVVNYIFGFETKDEALNGIKWELLFSIGLESFAFMAKSAITPVNKAMNSMKVCVDPGEAERLLKKIIDNPKVPEGYKRDSVIEILLHLDEESNNIMDIFRKIVDSNSYDACIEDFRNVFELLDVDQYKSFLSEYESFMNKDWLKNELSDILESIVPNFDKAEFHNYVDNNFRIIDEADWNRVTGYDYNVKGFYNGVNDSITMQNTGNLFQIKTTVLHEFAHKFSTPYLYNGSGPYITGFNVQTEWFSFRLAFNETVTDFIAHMYLGNDWTYRNLGYSLYNNEFYKIINITKGWEPPITPEFIKDCYFRNDVKAVRNAFDSHLGEGFFDELEKAFDFLAGCSDETKRYKPIYNVLEKIFLYGH